MTQSFLDTLDKKTAMEQELKQLEQQIYELEGHYLEETMNTGNIIKGWEGYFTNKTTKQPLISSTIKRPKINPNDRIFSLSSTTSPAVTNVEENLERNINNSLGLPTYYKTKRNKKKKPYAKLSRPNTESPSKLQEQESSQIQEYILEGESSQINEEDLVEDDPKGKTPNKKKKIKKNKKNKKIKAKQ